MGRLTIEEIEFSINKLSNGACSYIPFTEFWPILKQLADIMQENKQLKENLKIMMENFKKYVSTQNKPFMGYDVEEVKEALRNKDSDNG